MCVNAWQLGIPAICIGEGSGKPQHSLSDKKKEVLYEMYGARQFYIFLEEIRSIQGLIGEAKRAAAIIKRRDISDKVTNNIQIHSKTALLRLSNAIKELV